MSADTEAERDRQHAERRAARAERKHKGGLLIVLAMAMAMAVAGTPLHAAAPGSEPPRRIVSLNLCIDAILLAVAPREQIVALSHYSLDPQRSTVAALASTFPTTHESAEEVMLLRPDLVLGTRHSALSTRTALTRLGMRVKTYGVPDSIEASLAQVMEVANDIGRQEQGRELVARIRDALRAAAIRGADRKITAAIYQPGGMTAGPRTLPGELMRIAGFVNIAGERYGIDYWRPLSLELLVSNPPEILLAGEGTDVALTRTERLLRHRALLRLEPQMTRVRFPTRLMYCAGPVMLHTLAALEAARDQAYARASVPR